MAPGELLGAIATAALRRGIHALAGSPVAAKRRCPGRVAADRKDRALQPRPHALGDIPLPGVSRCDVICYWESAGGHGGPEFSPEILGRLAKHGVTLGLDT